jgi:hypothetical protein
MGFSPQMKFTQRDQNCVIATLTRFREQHVPAWARGRFTDHILWVLAHTILTDLETLHSNQENTK